MSRTAAMVGLLLWAMLAIGLVVWLHQENPRMGNAELLQAYWPVWAGAGLVGVVLMAMVGGGEGLAPLIQAGTGNGRA